MSQQQFMTPTMIASQSRVHAKKLVDRAKQNLSELTDASDSAKYDNIRGPLTECAELLEQIAQRLQNHSETAKDMLE